ncbi:hypothetical protein HDU83_004968 [Entophlyctis luteolus]|nr:hypothetical protein HDU83_004968 [Entophlyctis luteolus]
MKASAIPVDNASSQIALLIKEAFANESWAQNVIPKKAPVPAIESIQPPKNAQPATSFVDYSRPDSVAINAGL